MFGAFYSGDFYFGKSIWGPKSPIRTNPDIDGSFAIGDTVTGSLQPTSYESGAFTRTEAVVSPFYTADATEQGQFINTENPAAPLTRLK